MIGNVRLLLQG